MWRRWAFDWVFFMFLMASLSACSAEPVTNPRDAADANDTGRRVAPNGESERAVLRELSLLPSGAPRRVGDTTVLAEAPYQAASGKTCRALHLTLDRPPSKRHRLACSDGKGWFFVPDVFGDNRSE